MRLEHLDQLRGQFRCDGVVGMRPVEGDDRHAPIRDELDQDEFIGLVRRRPACDNRVAASAWYCGQS